MPTSLHDHFASDYAHARARFRIACAQAGLQIESWTHPLRGRDGEELAIDAVWIGERSARRVLLTVSGTHGIEGFYGSGCQVGWLRQGHFRSLPAGTAMLMLHAVNPWGFSWLRRVNEDNIDINRNFLAFDRKLPDNPGYFEIARTLAPEHWDAASEARIAGELAAWTRRVGLAAAARAISAGQHTHPNGLFYGGTAPCWSHRTVHTIATHFLEQVEQLCILDFHTGLGPSGHSEMICRHPIGSPALARARQWFGSAVTSPEAGESQSPVIEGNLRMGFAHLLADAEVVAAAIEVGTVGAEETTLALIADNWLHLHGDAASPTGQAIKARLRAAFYPDSEDWRAACYPRAVEIQQQALAGLAAA